MFTGLGKEEATTSKYYRGLQRDRTAHFCIGNYLGASKSQPFGGSRKKDYRILGVYIGVPYLGRLLGGSWDLVTTYNWACNPTYNPPKWAYRGYPNYK